MEAYIPPQQLNLKDVTDEIKSHDVSSSRNQRATAPAGLSDQQREKVIQNARRYIGDPYAWGGAEPATGFDCSGLVFYLYKSAGVSQPPRTTLQLWEQRFNAADLRVRPADLVFFTHPGSANPGHVGIIISPGAGDMIHASTSAGVQLINYKTSLYWSQRFTWAGPVKTP